MRFWSRCHGSLLDSAMALMLPVMLGLTLVLLLATPPAAAAPPRKGKVFGPCVGMECLHGVLMHGDAKLGDAHAVEDAEKHREELDRLAAKGDASGRPGQLNQEEFLHGVLMHGDAKAGGAAAHSHEAAPSVEKRPEQSGPMDQEQLMHGILMHGDADPGHLARHDAEDKARRLAADKSATAAGVPGVESRPSSGYEDESSLLRRWWNTLKLLVIGDDTASSGSGSGKSLDGGSTGDYNLLHDLGAVGSTKTVAELEKAAGHSHRDDERVHRERDRREHAGQVHIEH